MAIAAARACRREKNEARREGKTVVNIREGKTVVNILYRKPPKLMKVLTYDPLKLIATVDSYPIQEFYCKIWIQVRNSGDSATIIQCVADDDPP